MSRILSRLAWGGASLLAAMAIVAAAVLAVAGLLYRDPDRAPTPAGLPHLSSLYLTMRDGTRIAADVWLPPSLAAGERVPVLIKGTPYWRASALSFLGKALWTLGEHPRRGDPDTPILNRRGYAVVAVDTRGTGASFGHQAAPLDDPEVQDFGQVIDWASRQPWSSGRVGAYGFSYRGMLAVDMASLGRPALKAIAPSFDFTDVYLATWPGGAFSETFLKKWGAQTADLNRGKPPCAGLCRLMIAGPRPVDADADGGLLKAAIADHRLNYDVFDCARAAPDRDSRICASGRSLTDVSENAREPGVAAARLPIYVTVGWLDADSAAQALRRLATFPNPQTLVVGAISHGGFMSTDPFASADADVDPTYPRQIQDMADFFDRYLKRSEAPGPSGVSYEILNGGGWRAAPAWPPPGAIAARYYFAPGGSLGLQPPESAGEDRYKVDFTASSGPLSRWQSPVDLSRTSYPDRAAADRKLLTYTSAPLGQDLMIAGDPEADLALSTTARDGIVIVYLEDVLPSGRVVYLGEGVLRLEHRRPATAPVPVTQSADPLHSYLARDDAPMAPGRAEEIRIGLSPIAVRVRQGERIRIAIAGADAANLQRVPASGDATLALSRGGPGGSYVDLPVLSAAAAQR